jgi:hypothetical protein
LDVAALVKAALAEALPAAVQIAMQVANTPRATPQEAVAAVETGRCQDCNQPIIRGKYACNKEHRTACIFPEESPEYFPGLGLNGHWYKSNGFGHYVMIPKDFNAEEMLRRWDLSEKEARTGKKRLVKQYEADFRHNKANF